jgi:hypothetical protein
MWLIASTDSSPRRDCGDRTASAVGDQGEAREADLVGESSSPARRRSRGDADWRESFRVQALAGAAAMAHFRRRRPRECFSPSRRRCVSPANRSCRWLPSAAFCFQSDRGQAALLCKRVVALVARRRVADGRLVHGWRQCLYVSERSWTPPYPAWLSANGVPTPR